MCEWSLTACKTRDAVVDDQLISGRIQTINSTWMTSTSGFYSPAEPDVAVCLRPGTELAFDEPVQFEGYLVGMIKTVKSKGTTAVFREHNLDQPCTHHDTLEFPDGSKVLVHHLIPGQRARVLQLGVDPKMARAEGQPQTEAVT